jgi:hypothetical protein
MYAQALRHPMSALQAWAVGLSAANATLSEISRLPLSAGDRFRQLAPRASAIALARHRDRPMGRRARRDVRLLSPGAITRLACSARSLATASTRASPPAGVIPSPRKGASAPTDADDRFDDSPTSAGRSPPTDRARPEPASRRSGTGAVSGARFSRQAIVTRGRR